MHIKTWFTNFKSLHTLIRCVYAFRPDSSDQYRYKENIEWERVFTDGPRKGKQGVVDSDGNYAVIFMPDDQSRIHKIDENTGERIWTATIEHTAGFGISEIKDAGRSDYIASGGIGETQERWVARLNGDDGSTMWSKTYHSDGESWQYDGIRMTIVGSDGYIYGAGFIEAMNRELYLWCMVVMQQL